MVEHISTLEPDAAEADSIFSLTLKLNTRAGKLANNAESVERRDAFKPGTQFLLEKHTMQTLKALYRLADELGVDLDDLMAENMGKLEDRKERGVITGSGDDR